MNALIKRKKWVLRIVGILALACAAGCADDGQESQQETFLELSLDGVEPVELEEGALLEDRAKDRSAVVAILRGAVERDSSQPYSAELVRAIEAEVYRDVDPGTGPEFWIMEASVEDADGNVLWTDRENGVFQLVEFLQVILEEQDIPLNAEQVFRFVEREYPQLTEFAVRVPTGLQGGVDYVLKIPEQDGELYEVVRLPIEALVDGAEPPQTEGTVETLVESAPPKDALDIVILGDGYIAQDREKFTLDVQAVSEALIESEPFATHRESLNIRSVFVESNERGAGYDCTGNPLLDGGCKEGLRDSPFGTVFVITAIADILGLDLGNVSDRVAMPIEVASIYDAASLANYDEIIVVSNTRRRSGFAGLYVSLVTSFDRSRVEFPNVAVHELGHSFGVLGDEYQVSGDPCLFNEPRVPLPANIAPFQEPDFKWDRWFLDDTPVPTPEEDADEFPIGAYEGAYNCDFLFRPAHSCKMNRNEAEPFCSVCLEQVTRRVYSVIDPVPSEPAVVERVDASTLRFELPVYPDWEDRFEIQWTLNQTPIDGQATLELDAQLHAEQLEGNDSEWLELKARISDATSTIRIEDQTWQSELVWYVRSR